MDDDNETGTEAEDTGETNDTAAHVNLDEAEQRFKDLFEQQKAALAELMAPFTQRLDALEQKLGQSDAASAHERLDILETKLTGLGVRI